MLTTQSALRKDTRTGLADMQHRHFTTIATIIRRIADVDQRDEMALHFAEELRCTNPKFDWARFLRACGTNA